MQILGNQIEVSQRELARNVKELAKLNYSMMGRDDYDFDTERHNMLVQHLEALTDRVRRLNKKLIIKRYRIIKYDGNIEKIIIPPDSLHLVVCGCQQLNAGFPIPIDIQLYVSYKYSVKKPALTNLYKFLLSKYCQIAYILGYMTEHACISLEILHFMSKQPKQRWKVMEYIKSNCKGNLLFDATQYDVAGPAPYRSITTNYFWVHGLRLYTYEYLQTDLNKGTFWMHIIHKLALKIFDPLKEWILLYKDQTRPAVGGIVLNIYGPKVYDDPIIKALLQGMKRLYSASSYFVQFQAQDFESLIKREDNICLNQARTIAVIAKQSTKFDWNLNHILEENVRQGCVFFPFNKFHTDHNCKKRAFLIFTDKKLNLKQAFYLQFPTKRFAKLNKKYKIDFLAWFSNFNTRSCQKNQHYECLGSYLWSILLSLQDFFIEKIDNHALCSDIFKYRLDKLQYPNSFTVQVTNSV